MKRTEIVSVFQKRAFGLALTIGAASFVMAQQKVSISGNVKDTNGGIGYSSITFKNTQNAQLSDAVLADVNGNYKLELTPGSYDVSIEAVDYKKLSKSVAITKAGAIAPFVIVSDGKANLNNTTDIQGVVITATTKPLKVEIDKKTYDVKSDLTAIGGNLQDVLQNVPSVSVDPDGTVSMRGSSNVKFLVNGKPSALLGIDDGANALQAIPADQIDRIEVITNPSSKYDASGTAGILNIILKKNTKMGFNGSTVGTLGYLPKTSLNANLNWRKGNWTWFVNGGGGYNESKSKNWTDANYTTFPLYDTVDLIDRYQERGYQISSSKNNAKNYNGTAGLVYDINKKTSINASLTIRSFNMDNKAPVAYTDYLTNGDVVTGFRNSTGTNSNNGAQADVGLDHKFDDKGQNISLSLSLQKNDSEGNTKVDQNYRSKILQDAINQKTNNKSLVGKLDYELPIGESSTFNAGYKIDVNHNDYNFGVLRKNEDDLDFSTSGVKDYNNTTNYRENINAVYVQYKSKIGNLGYQVGLRDEMSNITLDYQNLSGNNNIDNRKKNYNNLFPSVFLSYNFSKDNQFLLNYSRRIDRPRSFFLVPFMSFNDSQNIFKGNPDLNPAYIDSFEFGYNISKRKFSLNPTLYFRKENDDVKMTLVYINGTFISQPQNLGYDERFGLDLNYSYDPFAWWKIMGEVDVYGYKTSGDYSYTDSTGKVVPISYDGSGTSTRLRMSNTFKIDKTFSVQVQGNYRGAQVEGANDQKATYFINMGASKTIWKGDGTIAFNVQDIFNTRARNVIQTGDGYTRESYMQWQPRQASISLTYRFKQGEKVEQPKRKKDINSNAGGDEQQGPM